jgi:hypothetical protein
MTSPRLILAALIAATAVAAAQSQPDSSGPRPAKPDLPESPAQTKAKLAKSQATASALESAINQFFLEYAALPDVGDHVETNTAKGTKMLEILLGIEGDSDKAQNARAIKFLTVKETKTKTNGLLYDSSGKSVVGLYDFWGNPFSVVLDWTYEERLRFSLGSKRLTLNGRRCAIYSPGADKKLGTDDDVKTW